MNVTLLGGSRFSRFIGRTLRVLQGKGSISNREMEEHVDAVYEAFNARRKALAAAVAEQTELELLAIEEKIEGREK